MLHAIVGHAFAHGSKGQGQKSWQTNESILDVQHGRASVEKDLYPYDGVVEKLQRPEPFDY